MHSQVGCATAAANVSTNSHSERSEESAFVLNSREKQIPRACLRHAGKTAPRNDKRAVAAHDASRRTARIHHDTPMSPKKWIRLPKAQDGKNHRLFEQYRPFSRQAEFHRSHAKYRLFGGAAGPGKTKALLWEAIFQANEVAGCDTLLLRRTYPELESSLLAYFRRDVPRKFYKSYNESKHVVTWLNGSTTRFGYCRNENDVYQYQGAEFLFIGLDELTHFTLKQWQFLTSRNRCPVPGSFPCMAVATNPGNIGHAWVKALWVDQA